MASWLERLLGKAETVKSHESQSMGGNSQRDGVNIQRQVKQESVVMATEIQNLPDLTGYLKLPTGPIWKVRYAPNRARQIKQKGFIMREEAPRTEADRVPTLGEALAAAEAGELERARKLALDVLDSKKRSSNNAPCG